MRFGSREICNVVFKAKADQQIGASEFKEGQPVLYIDTAKTSTLESSATTVYATGGRGNTNLVAWEGEKTLTFTVEDALISPIGMAVLSGAGLVKAASTSSEKVNFHVSANATANENGIIDLLEALPSSNDKICKGAPIFVVAADKDGSVTGEKLLVAAGDGSITSSTITLSSESITKLASLQNNNQVFVDFYVEKGAAQLTEIQIDAGNFGGYYYVEADTLYRRQIDGVDLPAQITLPNVKIQSNFSFSMASTGDPSTFSFVMDAFPGYTYFNKSKKVLCVMQILDNSETTAAELKTVMGCSAAIENGLTIGDSYPGLRT